MNGSGIVYCEKDYNISTTAIVTKTSGDTVTVIFSLYSSDTSKVDLYSTAYEYT